MSSVYSCVYTGILGSTGGHCRSSPSAGSTRPSQQFSYCTRSHTVKPSTEAPRCMSGNNNDILTSELWLPRRPLKETFTESGCAVVYIPDCVSLCDRSVAADCVKGSYCWTNSIAPDRRHDCYQPTRAVAGDKTSCCQRVSFSKGGLQKKKILPPSRQSCTIFVPCPCQKTLVSFGCPVTRKNGKHTRTMQVWNINLQLGSGRDHSTK